MFAFGLCACICQNLNFRCKNWIRVPSCCYRCLIITLAAEMSRDMTKPIKWVCAQRRLRWAWASAQSDQSLRCPHDEKCGSLPTHWAQAKTDQTGRMPRLIRVFAGRTVTLLVLSCRCSNGGKMKNLKKCFSFSHWFDLVSCRTNLVKPLRANVREKNRMIYKSWKKKKKT